MRIKAFGFTEEELHENGSFFTAKEIYGQPELWIKTFNMFKKNSLMLKEFLNDILEKQNLQIILAGAGTSAYIGEVLVGPIQKKLKIPTRAIPTTDLVTHPELFILKETPTLLVSFARSGNSPESVKAVELGNTVSGDIYHLIITCNPDGELAKNIKDKNTFVIILPEEANDKSLAMTGSFSSMLLVGLFLADINNLEHVEKQVELLNTYGKRIFNVYLGEIEKIAKLDFKRAVFLGSGLFSGIARESHLKLQELTDGKIICKYDTFLGFRHGPKAVIDEKTLIVYLFSNNTYSQQYEIDLVKSVANSGNGCYKVGVMEKNIPQIKLDSKIVLSENGKILDEEYLTVAEVLFAQTLGLFKSIDLGLKPDTPSVSGMIHRVVQGVKLYYYNGKATNGLL